MEHGPSILKPHLTNSLTSDALGNKGTKNENDENNMVRIASEYREELMKDPTQPKDSKLNSLHVSYEDDNNFNKMSETEQCNFREN